MNYFSRIPSKYFGFLSHFVLRKKPTLFGKLAWLPLISHILALHYGLKIIILAILSIYIANEFVELQTDGNPPFGSFFLICVIAIIATGFEFERLNKTVTYSPIFASFHWPKILAATYFVVSVIMLWYFNSKFFWNIQMGVFYSIITPIADTFFDASPKEHITEITQMMKLKEIPTRESVSEGNWVLGYYIGDSLKTLCINILGYTVLCWISFSLMYQVPILSFSIQASTLALTWNYLSGWELLSYFGTFLQEISNNFDVVLSIFILISYLFALFTKILSYVEFE